MRALFAAVLLVPWLSANAESCSNDVNAAIQQDGDQGLELLQVQKQQLDDAADESKRSDEDWVRYNPPGWRGGYGRGYVYHNPPGWRGGPGHGTTYYRRSPYGSTYYHHRGYGYRHGTTIYHHHGWR